MRLPKIKGTSLKQKIILFIIIISVYPMVLMSIIAAYNYDNIIKERFISYSQENMNRIASYLNGDVEDMKNSVISMLQDPTFYDMALKQPNTEINSFGMFSLRQDIRAYLSTIVFAKKNFDIGGIYFYDNTQNIFYPEKAGLIQEEDIPYLSMREATEGVRNSQFYFIEHDNIIDIYLIQPLLHKDTFKPIGLIYYRLDPDYIKNLIINNYSKQDETLFLYSKDGVLISRQGTMSGEKIIEENSYYNQEPGVYIYNNNGEDYYIITENIVQLNLTVITTISSEILTQDSRKVIDLITILYLVNIPIFIIMANFLYGNIVKPVNHLIEKMNRFEEGKFDTVVEKKRKDEFGYLYTAFNKMTTNINSLVKDVYIEELARKDAEIAALQEQINPHFLYNTLESINWRAQLAGEQEIALMIQALSKLMDASINRDAEKFVTLEREAQYMEQYMFLVQMRYSDSLVFNMEIAPESKQLMVPKLIIQPLLENSVKHGIEPVGEGSITLRSYIKDASLFIEVEDNGQGMSPKVLERIRDIVKLERINVNLQKGKRQSIGFQNVARRLQLIYNQEADIFIESQETKGTKITIVTRIRDLTVSENTL